MDMLQSYGKSALAQQIDVASQDFFSIEVIGVFDFPGVGAVLARTIVIGTVPVVFEVGELVYEFSPAVIDADFYL
jgi:hypothetical protein